MVSFLSCGSDSMKVACELLGDPRSQRMSYELLFERDEIQQAIAQLSSVTGSHTLVWVGTAVASVLLASFCTAVASRLTLLVLSLSLLPPMIPLRRTRRGGHLTVRGKLGGEETLRPPTRNSLFCFFHCRVAVVPYKSAHVDTLASSSSSTGSFLLWFIGARARSRCCDKLAPPPVMC